MAKDDLYELKIMHIENEEDLLKNDDKLLLVMDFNTKETKMVKILQTIFKKNNQKNTLDIKHIFNLNTIDLYSKYKNLIKYTNDKTHITLHIRRGDIMQTPTEPRNVYLNRYVNENLFLEILENIVKMYQENM